MKTLAKKAANCVAAMAVIGLLLGTPAKAQAAEPACSVGPMVKNLGSLTYRAPCAQVGVSQAITKKEAHRLAAIAESRGDHLKLARYYQAQADSLGARAAGYEEAAAAYRRGPFVKNLMAPTAAGRYEYFAKGHREEAKSNRLLEQSHEKMAKAVAAL